MGSILGYPNLGKVPNLAFSCDFNGSRFSFYMLLGLRKGNLDHPPPPSEAGSAPAAFYEETRPRSVQGVTLQENDAHLCKARAVAPPIRCAACGKTFQDAYAYNQHWKANHEVQQAVYADEADRATTVSRAGMDRPPARLARRPGQAGNVGEYSQAAPPAPALATAAAARSTPPPTRDALANFLHATSELLRRLSKMSLYHVTISG